MIAGLLIGLGLGVGFGVLIYCACACAGEADDASERAALRRQEYDFGHRVGYAVDQMRREYVQAQRPSRFSKLTPNGDDDGR